MFESLMERAKRAAERRAAARALGLAEALVERISGDVEIAAGADGLRLSGPSLKRRLTLDPRFRWALAGWLR